MDLEPMFKGATFDDFLVRPQFSVLETRREADISMPLTKRVRLSLPIVAANMHTVTGEETAEVMALEGGFAFLPRHSSIEKQAKIVRNVKRKYSLVIENPLCIHRQATISQAMELMEKHGISCLLVERDPGDRRFAGILCQRDIEMARGENGTQRTVATYMTRMGPSFIWTSPKVTMAEAENLMLRSRVEKLPLLETVGLDLFRIKGLITKKDLRLAKKKPYSTKDTKGRLLVGATIGATGDYLERAEELVKEEVDCILMDIAHADSVVMKNGINSFRKRFDGIELVCGNVGTFEGAELLSQLGVDSIKVGVGPGKGCRTRLETGAGVPQVQAIREAYLAVKNEVPIIADGGMKEDKDIALAILVGGSTVMLGSMLAGTDETPGIMIQDPHTKQQVKIYRGMTAPETIVETVKDELAEEALKTPAEGMSHEIPCIGPITNVLNRIRGHLQSAVSYAGERTLGDAREKIASNPTEFLERLTESSRKESFER